MVAKREQPSSSCAGYDGRRPLLSQPINIGRHLWDQNAINRGDDGGFKSGEAGVVTEHPKQDGIAVRACGRTDTADIFSRPVDRGLKAETVLSPRNIVIHGFRDGPDGHALRRQDRSDALRGIAPDDDQTIELQKAHILQDLGDQIHALFRLASFPIRGEMGRQVADFDIGRVGMCRLQYRAAQTIIVRVERRVSGMI